MKYDFSHFKEGLSKLNISYSDVKLEEKFSIFYDMLIERNKVMNLTAITEFDEVIEKHFLDSIALGSFIDLTRPCKLIDLGTGAGFPGIPLKILFPQLDIVLVDSLNKRVKFLEEVILTLQLEKISAIHGRAEELAKKVEFREQFDYCVSRAVANLSTLCEYCLPFVKLGGKFCAYKSKDVENEVENAKKAIYLLGGMLSNVHKFQLPDTDYERAFVVIEKREKTAKKYPRKAGMPGKEPLL